jgi:hypothetical protein
MKTKKENPPCSCGQSSNVSVTVTLSTLKRTPRKQEFVDANHFCISCLQSSAAKNERLPIYNYARAVNSLDSLLTSTHDIAATHESSDTNEPRSGSRFLSLPTTE